MIDWVLSTAATFLALLALWLYGNKQLISPLIYILSILVWIVYDVLNEQWPLLLPCFLNLGVQLRNLYLWRMDIDLTETD